MEKNKYLVWFDQVDKDDINLVGGKGANLGEMTQAGLPVPPGFILTAAAYFEFIKQSGIKREISQKLSTIDCRNSKELQSISKQIRELIVRAPVPQEIVKGIFDYYHNLHKQCLKKGNFFKKFRKSLEEPLVAVRSSATAEDLPDASFAGQQATFLNVKGDANVMEAVRKAWASLFTARAIFYRAEKGFDHLKVGIALPIERMIDSRNSGVMFTLDPITNNKEHIVIEAIYGLGELIVQGAVTPDHYVVNKKSFKIESKNIGRQEEKMIFKNNKNATIKIDKKTAAIQKITDKQIVQLAKYAKKLEDHYYFPQDIEWAIEDDQIFITQTRPVTTISKEKTKAQISGQETQTDMLDKNLELFLTGNSASPGIASGKVVIIHSASEIDKVKGGDVLVAPKTDPDFVPAMRRAIAIITEKGGRTSHAAIVSRELGIPAVVGVEAATKRIAQNQVVTVDGSTGKIYKGGLSKGMRLTLESAAKSANKTYKKLKTATNVYVNLAGTNRVEEIAANNVDGVGLLRAEFMIADIGYHPNYLIQQKKQKLFIDRMVENLKIFCENFGTNRPVVYRATDFKTNEYKNLKGGDAYEPDEENPMIGYRGAYRYISNPEVFKLELEVIKKVRNKYGYKNLWLMIPFVHTPAEMMQVKKLIQESGLSRSASFKLWMMVEVPSNVILIEEFIKVGIDGISIGSNDLTQLTLGIDRDSEKIAKQFNELDPAVLWSIERVIRAASKHKITSSICGQAPSDYPDLIEKLINWGITSVSVNVDAIDRTREYIYECEKKLVKNSKPGR